jgi:hypothetical protein
MPGDSAPGTLSTTSLRRRARALLFAENKSMGSESSLLLIPESRLVGNRRFNIYLPESGLMPVEFAEGPDGGVDLYMEPVEAPQEV